jgi:hypothetical protein
MILTVLCAVSVLQGIVSNEQCLHELEQVLLLAKIETKEIEAPLQWNGGESW